MPDITTLVFTTEFLQSLLVGKWSEKERKRFDAALALLDTNEKHPSLRMHQLKRDMRGQWSASASHDLRITFERLDDGRKRLLECSRHYGD